MKPLYSFFVCIFLFATHAAKAQNHETLKSINLEVWSSFTKAYETLDFNLFASIHSDSLIRISGNSKHIKNKMEYIEGYKSWWKDASLNQTISFRFLERIQNGEKASERGIYKLTQNAKTSDEKSYYGKFHVIHIKENGVWKILVDYDSNENDSINESSYQSAFAIDDFSKF
ncbi:nuclear transport factor 2 family protein [Hyunsoonleella flava]|uniref:Nuclear transport factor 2 family protein n=1 Tax=Hyunsoonleella flava TaxID=2527939 RepID=A0A4Q9FET1_9FLAO|nr:nuclear transport factor 2 family protein [Hyunsoonleella flava]TBN04367.1 nuclear transport factor 2 family protein [Hyunsoonleella flava]